MGKILSVLLLLFLSMPALAQDFDFNQSGDKDSNAILMDYIKTNEIEGFHDGVVSYF